MDLASGKKQTFWRFHPVTGADANEFTEELKTATPEQKQELASTIRHGAKFYWDKVGDTYDRIERANVAFVLKVMAVDAEWIDAQPGEDS